MALWQSIAPPPALDSSEPKEPAGSAWITCILALVIVTLLSISVTLKLENLTSINW